GRLIEEYARHVFLRQWLMLTQETVMVRDCGPPSWRCRESKRFNTEGSEKHGGHGERRPAREARQTNILTRAGCSLSPGPSPCLRVKIPFYAKSLDSSARTLSGTTAMWP